MPITTSNVPYRYAGKTYLGYQATPSGGEGKLPAVIVVHEWWGQNDFSKRRAEMIAELGYVGFAVDMYGDGVTAENPTEAEALMMKVVSDPESAKGRFVAALDTVRARDDVDPNRIAAIGFCFGGGVVLHMARAGLDLKGVATFHGSLPTETAAKPGAIKAKIAVYTGADDPMASDEVVKAFEKEMKSAGADFEIVAYPGVLHGFTNPAATERGKKYSMPLAYDKDADQDSWKRLKAFLTDVFA